MPSPLPAVTRPSRSPGASSVRTLSAALLVASAATGCAAVVPAVPPVTAEQGGWIESRTYVVPAPGEGWGLEVERPADRIAFEIERTAPDEHVVWQFRVEAAAGPTIADDAALDSEEELAARCLADEEARARRDGKRLDRGVESIGGKRVHFVRWEDSPWTKVGLLPVPGDRRTELYVYFPPERGGRVAYTFRIVEKRERSNLYAPAFDRTRAYPFIAGFRVK
jgi:hypothetical protein